MKRLIHEKARPYSDVGMVQTNTSESVHSETFACDLRKCELYIFEGIYFLPLGWPPHGSGVLKLSIKS